MLIHGSELVAVAQGLIRGWWNIGTIGGVSRLHDTISKIRARLTERNEQGDNTTLGTKCVRRNLVGVPRSPRRSVSYFVDLGKLVGDRKARVGGILRDGDVEAPLGGPVEGVRSLEVRDLAAGLFEMRDCL